MIGSLLGHSPKGITSIYTHLFKEAFDGVEEALDTVFGVNEASTDCSVTTDNHRTPVSAQKPERPLAKQDSELQPVSDGVVY